MSERLRYGVVCINKPPGPSSHEVSAFVKKLLRVERTGHTGTLDQNVSGVLVVLINESRKSATYLMQSRKTYVCVMRTAQAVSKSDLEDAFQHFRGPIFQKPPEASAVRRVLRVRRIHSLQLLEMEGKSVLFQCECDAGTYIRKLVYDIGEILGMETEMKELRRIEAAGLSESRGITLQQLADYYWLATEKGRPKHLESALIPIEEVIEKALKKVVVTDEALSSISHGVPPRVSQIVEMPDRIHVGETLSGFTLKGELAFILQATLSEKEILELHEKEHDTEFARVVRVVHAF